MQSSQTVFLFLSPPGCSMVSASTIYNNGCLFLPTGDILCLDCSCRCVWGNTHALPQRAMFLVVYLQCKYSLKKEELEGGGRRKGFRKTHLNPLRYSRTVHSTGHIHSVPPNIILRLACSYDPSYHRANIKPYQ